MVVGPIPWTAAVEYGRMKGLEPDMLDVFIRVIREMDEVYIGENNKKQKQKMSERNG